jgi:hypothetical protein
MTPPKAITALRNNAQLNYYFLNEAASGGGRPVVLNTVDPTQNDLKLVLPNASDAARVLTGGIPQAMGSGTASTLYFQLPMQETAETNAIALAAASQADWRIGHFDDHVGLAPANDMTIPAGASVTVHLRNIAVNRGHGAGAAILLNARRCPPELDWGSASQGVTWTTGKAPHDPLPREAYAFNAQDLAGGGAQINITALSDANVLKLTLLNPTTRPISPRDTWGEPAPYFTLTFSIGRTDSDVAPLDLVANISVEPWPGQSHGWTVEPSRVERFPQWTMRPDPRSKAVLDVGEQVAFKVTRVVTLPKATPRTLALVMLANYSLTDYRDSTNLLTLEKGFFPKIVTFTFQSRHEPQNKINAARGDTAFECFAGDTVTVAWETCGSDPTRSEDRACALSRQGGVPAAVPAAHTETFKAERAGQWQLTCYGACGASNAVKTVGVGIKPPRITLEDTSHAASIRLAWTFVGVKKTLTLRGPGIESPLDVTNRTEYMPLTTFEWDLRREDDWTLVCDDGVNPPVVDTCPVKRWSQADVSAVFTPVRGGISWWSIGFAPYVEPGPPEGVVSDVFVGANWRDGERGKITVYWTQGSAVVSVPYPSPYTDPWPHPDRWPRPSVRAGDALSVASHHAQDGTFVMGLARDESKQLYRVEMTGGSGRAALRDRNGNSVFSQLAVPRVRFTAAQMETGGLCVTTGWPTPGTPDAALYIVAPPPARPSADPFPVESPGQQPPAIADFTLDYWSGDAYWIDSTAEQLFVARWTGDMATPWAAPTALCGVTLDPAVSSLTLDYTWGGTRWGDTRPRPTFCYWLEPTTVVGHRLLCRCPLTDGGRTEIAVVEATPGHSGMVVLGGPRVVA